MEEKNLFKIALFCSLIGLFIILLISEKIELKFYKISEINPSLIDKEIKTQGQIILIKETSGLYILKIKDNINYIDVVIFKEDKINLEIDNYIEVQGKVVEYRNKLEIQTNNIKILK